MKKHPELTHKVFFVTALPCVSRQGLEKVLRWIRSVQSLCMTRKSKFSVHFCCWLLSLNFMNCFLFQNLIFALYFFTDWFFPSLWNVSQDLANIMLAVMKCQVAYSPELPWSLAKVDCCQGWLLWTFPCSTSTWWLRVFPGHFYYGIEMKHRKLNSQFLAFCAFSLINVETWLL